MATNSDATAEGRAVFHVHEVSKTYHMGEADIPALCSVSLDLYPREFVVVLGASGSGKSTRLNILGGLDRVPEFGGYCVVGAAYGEKVEVDPDTGGVVNGKVYSLTTKRHSRYSTKTGNVRSRKRG